LNRISQAINICIKTGCLTARTGEQPCKISLHGQSPVSKHVTLRKKNSQKHEEALPVFLRKSMYLVADNFSERTDKNVYTNSL